MNPVKIEYYDRKGALLKTATFTDYKRYGAFWRVGQIEMTNHQTKKRSVLAWKKQVLPAGLDEDTFDRDALDE
jgi:hypothetical protein